MAKETILFNKTSPLSFLNWLETRDTVSPDITVNFKLYQDYVKEWYDKFNLKSYEGNSFFTNLYIDILKEITLNFTSEEEKRFIINFDYTKEENLDIILPFFIRKIKSICLYYSLQREKLKELVSLLPYKGTNFSISRVIKSIILNGVESGRSQKLLEGRTLMPAVSVISKNLNVHIEELYDDTDYFNIKYNDFEQLQTDNSDNDIDYNLYKDFKQAIINAIREYPVFEDSLINTLSLNLDLSGTELYLLKERDFIDYIKTNSTDDLKLNLKKRLAMKYVSSDFYYLSVGNTYNEIISGILFSSQPLSGEPIQNLTNVDKPTIATTQNVNNLYTAYYMGNFFTPIKTGILKYNTFSKSYSVNYSKLTPNSVYVFPDPNLYEGKDENPIIYKISLQHNKIGIQNQFRFGDVLSDRYDQLFYPYESLNQEVISQPYGLSLSIDNVDFWGGEKSNIWTNDDLWPGLDKVEKLQLESRHETLLFNKGICTDWYDDLYGNQFGLFKKLDEDYFISDKKKLKEGTLYVKNTVTGLVSTFQHFYKDLLLKYPDSVIKDIDRGVKTLYLINNLFVIETKKYVIADTYNFDFISGKFENSLLPSFYYPTYRINENLEQFVNPYYVDGTNTLYLCFLELNPSLSASNYKKITPKIFKINADNFDIQQSYPSKEYNVEVYSLSSSFDSFPEIDFRYIKGGKFSFKEKQNVFNLTYFAYNLNRTPFFINEQFSIQGGEEWLVSYIPSVNKPYLYSHDTNFANPAIDHTFKYGATYSEIVGNKDSYHFTFSKEDYKNDNFHFCSNINPVIINVPGSHYVNFDWNKYIFGSVFIGCDGITVSKIDNETIIDKKDGSPLIVLTEPEKWYWVFDKAYSSGVYSVSARYIKNTKNSIINFSIKTNRDTFSGVFCDNISSIYKVITIERTGDGLGTVKSDPFCIFCGDVASIVGATIVNPGSGYDSNTLFITISSNTKPTSFANLKANLNTRTGSVTSIDVLSRGAGYSRDSKIYINGNYSISATLIPEYRSFCTFLYPKYGTISFIPSAGFESIFTGWKGKGCEGVANRCLFTVTESETLTANFLRIPRYNVRVASNLPSASIVSLDGFIDYPRVSEASYLDGSSLVLSAGDVVGYEFKEFRNSSCGPNNPCGLNITQNITVTAVYLSSIIEMEVYKINPGMETGYILSKFGESEGAVAILNTSNGEPLIYSSVIPNQNTIFCSLCPDLPIKAFQKFDNVPRGTLVTLTAVPEGGYKFLYYRGSPCEGVGGDICSFPLTRYRSITGYFNYPTYTVSLILTGGLFYVTDNTLNCGNGFLKRYRRVCSFNYLSGSVISLSAIGYGTTGILYLSSYEFGGVQAGDLLDGEKILIHDYLVTKSFEITAAAIPDKKSTLTVIKSGSNLHNGYVNSILTLDAGDDYFYTMGQGLALSTFVLPEQSEVIIKNIFVPEEYRYLGMYGFSGLRTFYNEDGIITINPPPSAMLYEGESFIVNFPLVQNVGDSPYFTENLYDIIQVKNEETYLTITLNCSVIAEYTLNTLAEEMLLSSISNETEDILSVLV